MRQLKMRINSRTVWLDLMKAIALIWIFTNHFVEQIFGYPFIGNPSAHWPSLAERIAQLQPIEGYGIWTIPLNLLRYIGWSGDQGVQLFLIVSGFGLTWSLLVGQYQGILSFYLKRAKRIVPLWWGAHLFFIVMWIVVGVGLSPVNPKTYLSFLGLRVTPPLFYYFSPAWWFIGLIIQLYLIYPLLWLGLRRFGPLKFLIISCVCAFAIRGAGLYFLQESSYIDAWQRGAFFITRLPEFVFGISLAIWYYQNPDKTTRFLRSPSSVSLAIVMYLVGTALSLTLFGMTVAPFLLGVGAFVVLFTILTKMRSTTLCWVGRHSYSLYLMHHPWILFFIPYGLGSPNRIMMGLVAVIVLVLISSMLLEWIISMIGYKNPKVVLKRLVCSGVVLSVLLIGGELAVRWWSPQEVLGWGERPSLEPHPTFGWRLKPSVTTRLRWESYDYVVQANSLGFPAPEYPEMKSPGVFRVMTVGDAFTSAEGVDTDQAWPRLMESYLQDQMPERKVEVTNFAITGYGPNQYVAVLDTYAPKYHPDLIIVGFFVNEYQDVLWSNQQFQDSIGFHLMPQDGLYAIVRLHHLKKYFRLHLLEPLKEIFTDSPRGSGYFLGNFSSLEINRKEMQQSGRKIIAERLKQIKDISEKIDAKVVIMMIPAPVQVCKQDKLAYYPKHVDLDDANKFDLDQPQAFTKGISTSLGIPFYDLRAVLLSSDNCTYQPHNMHWTVEGHQRVAKHMSEILKGEVIPEHLEASNE